MSRKTNIRISEANKRTPWLLLLVLLGGFWLRVYRLGEQSLTWDELSTIARATIPIADMFDNLFTIRNHMPLYFLLMRGWVAIGEEEFIVRYFSLLMGLFSLVLIYKVGRRLGDKWISDQITKYR